MIMKKKDNDFNYVTDDSVADKKYEEFKALDPFPEIDSGLLNSADIADYALKTAMITPFNFENLKPASYEMALGTKSIYWDSEGTKKENYKLSKINEITFGRNSITYVSLESNFKIPDYIALRFNLVIQLVHKGLLLGTGPLINPGFYGELLIPVHNLTNNDCVIKPGETLISIEFTKLTKFHNWYSNNIAEKIFNKIPFKKNNRKGVYVEKRTKERKLTFENYVVTTFQGRHEKVQSSLDQVINKNEIELQKAKKYFELSIEKHDREVKKSNQITFWTSIIAFVTLFAVFISLFFDMRSVYTSALNLVADANKYVSDASLVFKEDSSGNKLYLKSFDKVNEITNKIENLNENYEALHQTYEALHQTIDSLMKEVDKLKNKIYTIESKKIIVSKDSL